MSAESNAAAVIKAGLSRGISPRGIKIALATALVESNLIMYANAKDPASLTYPHDAVGSDGTSVGIFQQQDFPEWGSVASRMDATASANVFFDHLVKFDYDNEGRSPGHYAQAVQRSAFPDRYDQRFREATAIYDRMIGGLKASPTPLEPDSPADGQVNLRWNCLGGQTIVQALAEVRDTLLGTSDSTKP